MRGAMQRWSILPGACVLALLVTATGCETTRARVLRPTCQRVQEGDALRALTFKANIETEGLVGEQLVYEVSLRNAALRPIKSTDGHYQNKAGAVAASKTLMVLQDPSTFEAVPLSIPVEQLQIRRDDWPVSAVFRLYNGAGECIAQASCAVPSEPAKRRAPTATAPVIVPVPPQTSPPKTSPPRERPAASQPTTRPTSRPTTRPAAQPTTRAAKPRTEPTELRPTPSRPTRPRGGTSRVEPGVPVVLVFADVHWVGAATGERAC